MLLKVAIKYYCVKNKGEIIYEENSIKRSMPITCIRFELKRSWVSKSNENNKIKEGQSISSEEAGMSINANGKNETFKPSDYTLEAKKEYVYEYLGLKFKLSDKFRNYIADKKIAMLDNQSPIDKELKYAILTFEKMTEEQKNAVIEKMGDGYKNWQNELERIGTIGIFEKIHQKKNI